MHGANRLGGNSLSDLIVFGKLAGDGAHQYITRLTSSPRMSNDPIIAGIRRATEILNRATGANPYLLHDKLQATMSKGVGIARTRDELALALEELDALKAEAATMR